MHNRIIKDCGFTLIEVVVVSVIVAILAAVAIPNYQAYLTQTRQDAVNDIADASAALAANYYKKFATEPLVSNLKINLDTSKYSITVVPPNLTITERGKSPNFSATRSYK